MFRSFAYFCLPSETTSNPGGNPFGSHSSEQLSSSHTEALQGSSCAPPCWARPRGASLAC